MADDNGVQEPTADYAVTPVKNGTYVRNPTTGQFAPGTTGRPLGAKNKRQTAADIADALGFNSVKESILQAQDLKAQLAADAFTSDYERAKARADYIELLKDLNQYTNNKLKSVESHTQVDIIAKLQSLDDLTDEELQALLDETAPLMRRQLPGSG